MQFETASRLYDIKQRHVDRMTSITSSIFDAYFSDMVHDELVNAIWEPVLLTCNISLKSQFFDEHGRN